MATMANGRVSPDYCITFWNNPYKDTLYFSSGHFQGVCAIFSHYVLNVKVTDYTTTDITAKAIQELMVTMETEILVPILKRCMNDKQVFEILFLEIMFSFPYQHYKLQ